MQTTIQIILKCAKRRKIEKGNGIMANITDIKRRILELAPGPFQEFCDTLIHKNEYGTINGLGMQAGTGNTTIGNPDTYVRKSNGKYIAVAYTIQQSNIYNKLKEDIDKALDPSKTGLENTEIEEIICCYTSSNLSAGDNKKLHDYCDKQGVILTLWGIDEISNQVHNRFRSMASDFLGLSIDTNQILSVEDFIRQYDANEMLAPLNTSFLHRKKEKEALIEKISENSVVVVTGRAGVGKTRLVLEAVREFATKEDYKLLCVKNNNLPLFKDLVASTEVKGKYLFFIDDANELAEISHILSYTTKKEDEGMVKIIATVRDYAKEKLIDEVKTYANPAVCELAYFSDEEIRVFLNINLEIRNEEYLNQIIRISEGNPRLAYMAGKLALEQEDLKAISDVSKLYDSYYKRYVDSAIGEDEKLCITAGILSIMNSVLLNNLSAINDVLELYGMSVKDFEKKIRQLHRIEVVEVHLDKVAVFSDQCLSNYILYYFFFQKKIRPLSTLLEIGYEHFRGRLIKTIDTIESIFNSEDVRKYCEEEILKVWDIFKQKDQTLYDKFARDFHTYNPTESFLIAKDKIEKLQKEDFEVYGIEFGKNNAVPDESILGFLDGYWCCENLDCMMELFLEYSSKSKENTVSGYRWLKNNYGLRYNDGQYGYYRQEKISSFLLNAAYKGNSVAMAIGLKWAIDSLSFSYSKIELGRNGEFTNHFWELKYSNNLHEYRNKCWDILTLLATNDNWKGQILLFLGKYSRNILNNVDVEIVSNEIDNMDNLLTKLKSNRIGFLKIVRSITRYYNKEKIKYNKKWDKILKGETWKVYNLLEFDSAASGLQFMEYKNKRNKKLSAYGKDLKISDISKLVQNVNIILSDDILSDESDDIQRGLENMICGLNKDQLQGILKAVIQFGSSIHINPFLVLERLVASDNTNALLLTLKNARFPQKNSWLFNYFMALPASKINTSMLAEVINFLKNDSYVGESVRYNRNLKILDKFLDINPNIYCEVSSILFGKAKTDRNLVSLYFASLFEEGNYSPMTVLELFKNDINLLQRIYFFALKNLGYVDISGEFLVQFLESGGSWIEKYAKNLWADFDSVFNCYSNELLWKTKYSFNFFDIIFDSALDKELASVSICDSFSRILSSIENDEEVKRNQKEWINHIIIENASNQKINFVFRAIRDLDNNIKRKAVQIFLDNNTSVDAFKVLPLLRSKYVGGALAYQKEIEFLESLYPFVSGYKFLSHKKEIEEKVVRLRKAIEKEECNLILRKTYY